MVLHYLTLAQVIRLRGLKPAWILFPRQQPTMANKQWLLLKLLRGKHSMDPIGRLRLGTLQMQMPMLP